MPKLILAITLMFAGILSIRFLSTSELEIAGTNLTSIGLLISGLVFYIGVLVIISMFENETLLSFSLLFPSMVAVGIFVYGFIAWSVRVSLSKWKGLNPDYTFVGLKQYTDLIFHDQRFLIDIRNTAVFTVGFILGCLFLGLGLAILLDQKLKGENLFRSIFLFPMSISFIASGVVWAWLMNPATGSRTTGLNLLFQSIGLDFLTSKWHATPPPWGMAYTVIPAIWQLAGFAMALYLGGIRSISEDIREAARVDGATEFEIYRYVILPMLRPVTLSAIIILGHIDGTNYAQGAAIGILMLISVAILVIPYLITSMRAEAEL
jgi:glucose/mannose transport system permease protein